MRYHVQKTIKDARLRYVNNIFEECTSSQERVKSNTKKSWSYNNLRGGFKGITLLRDNGILKINDKDQADILNKQFQSAFNIENDLEMPDMGFSKYSAMPELHIDSNGVLKS